MAWLSNTEHIWRYWGESYDLPGDRLPTPGKSDMWFSRGFHFSGNGGGHLDCFQMCRHSASTPQVANSSQQHDSLIFLPPVRMNEAALDSHTVWL
jgi:hypothetical protein